MQPPKTLFLIFHLSLLLFWKYHSSRQRLGSHGTTAAPQAFPFVTATNGASARGFVSVCGCACVIVGSYNSSRSQEQSPEQGGCSAFFFLLFFVLAVLSAAAAVCLYHTVSFWPCGSHGRTVAVLRGIRFVTATNGASVCACGRSIGRAILSTMSTRHKFQPALPLNFRSIHPRSTAAAQQQQQRCNTCEHRNAHIPGS